MKPNEWIDVYTKEAKRDLDKLKEPRATRARKLIAKVKQNPLPFTEGGYGKPLGNKRDNDLSGLLKAKLRGDGIRVVYKLERTEHLMKIIVIGVRDDMEVYKEAARRNAI